MSVVTEIREFEVPPCKVDKELLRLLGGVLESDNICQKERMAYMLYSRFRKIESVSSRDFIEADWPNDAGGIGISVGSKYPVLVSIQIPFGSMKDGKVVVTSTDATWANGISKRIEDIFMQKRLGYATLIEDFSSKAFVATMTWVSLSLALAYLVNIVFNPGFAVSFFLIFVFGGLVGGLPSVYYFLAWLFPKYEFGETFQKRFRKWIWSLLVSSGLIGLIIGRLTNSL
jgi:hypothetical protein